MAWVESHQEIGSHPKTLKAAKKLGINAPQMVGHLHLLWHWALAYADDGDLSRWDDDDVALGAQWDGDSGEFVRALANVGFIDESDGSRWLHDWMDYAGRLVRERERKRAARSKTPDTDPPPDDHASAERPQTDGGQEGDDPRAGTPPNPTPPNPTRPDQPNQPPDGEDAAASNGQRSRDYLFEAVVEACAVDMEHLTKPERGKVNKAVKDLREAGASPEGVRARARNYRERWPEVDLTPTGLANNYSKLGTKPPGGQRLTGLAEVF